MGVSHRRFQASFPARFTTVAVEAVGVRLRDVSAGRDLAMLRGHRRSVDDLTFSPDSNLVATASADNTVRLWHVPSGELAGVLEGHITGIQALAFAPDGKTLVSAANYESIKFWHVATRQEMLSFPEFSRDPKPILFSADGTTMAVRIGRSVLAPGEHARTSVKFWRAPSFAELEAAENTRPSRP